MVTAVTIVINTSVGIAGNHVIPLHAVSLAMLGRILAGARTDKIAATVTFAVHPMHAIVAGQRPFVLDGFNLSLFICGRHAAGLDFQRRIETGYFDLLIVVPTGQFRPPEYIASNTGYLEQFYRVVETKGQFQVMVRR